MQESSTTLKAFSYPRQLLKAHYWEAAPADFCRDVHESHHRRESDLPSQNPTLYTAPLSGILNWLNGLKNPGIPEEAPCVSPLLLYGEGLSFDSLLFHYQGTPESAQLIRRFVALFKTNISNSSATIISPGFIPKSKIKEEQELIQLISGSTSETSFIKFNFNKIGEFWAYAVKHGCTLFVTSKDYQADLANVLSHFYKGEMRYRKLSFYLAL